VVSPVCSRVPMSRKVDVDEWLRVDDRVLNPQRMMKRRETKRVW